MKKKVIIFIISLLVILVGVNYISSYYNGEGLTYYIGYIKGVFNKDGFENINIIATPNGNFLGFEKYIYADNLDHPSSLVFDGVNKRLFVAENGSNRITVLQDNNNDNKSDIKEVVIEDIFSPTGLEYFEGKLYISSLGKVSYVDGLLNNNTITKLVDLSINLPSGVNVTNDLVRGPDGWIYVAQGVGDINATEEEMNFYEGSILRINAETGQTDVLARGFYNPHDLAFHPVTSELICGDNAPKSLKTALVEELNVVFPLGDYGWPNCFGEDEREICEEKIYPILSLPKGVNVKGLAFNIYDQFPEQYKNNLFVVLQGKDNNDPNVGKSILNISMIPVSQGYEVKTTEFMTNLSSPIDIIFDTDGSFYVADYEDGIIYKIVAKYK